MSYRKLTKYLACLIVALTFLAVTTVTPSDVLAQGKPSFAGKKEEKGSRKDAAKAHADEQGEKAKKGKKDKKEKKAKKEKKSKKAKKEKKGKKGKKGKS